MSQLDPPKNLTRNVLAGMFAGVLIASIFFYFQDSISQSVFQGIEKYLFNLGGQIFKNLLLLIVVPLVFFSLVSGISSLSNMVKLGSIASKTVVLYLTTTAFAVIIAIFFGWVFNISGYEGEVGSFNAPSGEASLYDTVLRIFPNNIFARSVSKKMTKSFSSIYTDGTSDAMTPLTALALYDQFRELTPVGRRGDKIIQRLADRLVEVDLLDRASVLLDRQVRFRLQGVQKAQVGSRLALIRLLDRQPNTALEALDESVAPGLDPKLALQRKRLRARSVFELGDSETALKLIKNDNDRDADLLRADIFWRTRDWVSAGKVFERLIGNAGRDGRRINDLSAALILNWVVALSMSEQVDALNKVRQIYSTQMDMTEYRDAFRLITNKTEGDTQDFRTLTERFKEIGRFQAFLTTYREKLKTKLLSEMN